MRRRIALVLLAFALGVAGCGSSVAPVSVSVSAVQPSPSGATRITSAPTTASANCDREASLRPGPLPPPGAMPPDSTMAEIADRDLIAGVDQDTYLFGFRNPSTGKVEGFDIDIAREIARAIFGDPNRIQLRVLNPNQRESALQNGEVDVVVRTYSITCDRKQLVDFSTVYFIANQKILSVKNSGIDSFAALSGKRVCAVSGTTSLAKLYELNPKPEIFGATTWTDCLVMLQQGQVDAISTDDVVLKGLALQDPNVEVVGDSIAIEPYGIGVKKDDDELVRFVNGVLEKIREDGTWERLYQERLQSLGTSPGPPAARYED